jgi:DNA-nicking Smr family endonuclease
VGAKKKRKASGPFDALRALKDELSSREEKPPPPKPARVAAPERPPGAAVDDEAFLFHRLFAGVTPLDRSRGRVPKERGERSDASTGGARRVAEKAAERVAVDQADADTVHDRLRTLVEGGARFEVADDGRRVEGRRVDLPLEALRRLRRGLLPIDARLDLHGLRVEEARVQVEHFLRTMRARGERCLLVIHGKGEHSPHGAGVLRGEMAAWMSQGASSHHIAAFVTARETDGGEGAVYVLLRK